MTAEAQRHLSRRERQIMEIVYQCGRATVADVQRHIPDSPSYSAVRALMRILEHKGHLRHVRDGRRYLYEAVVTPEKARGAALRGLLRTFFGGSQSKLVAALLEDEGARPSDQELALMHRLIRKAREEGR